MSKNGKGSKQRPKTVDHKTWENNYERIFKHKRKKYNTNKLPKSK